MGFFIMVRIPTSFCGVRRPYISSVSFAFMTLDFSLSKIRFSVKSGLLLPPAQYIHAHVHDDSISGGGPGEDGESAGELVLRLAEGDTLWPIEHFVHDFLPADSR